MTKDEIRAELDEMEIEYPSTASKAELMALLPEEEEEEEEAPEEEAPEEEAPEEEAPEEEAPEEEEEPEPEPEAPKKSPRKKKAPEPVELSYEGLLYGPEKLLILSSRSMKLNRVDRIKILLADGTTCILLESELEAELVK